MISSYDLLELGFNPKYDGFKLLLEVVNEKISNPKVLATTSIGTVFSDSDKSEL